MDPPKVGMESTVDCLDRRRWALGLKMTFHHQLAWQKTEMNNQESPIQDIVPSVMRIEMLRENFKKLNRVNWSCVRAEHT